MSGRPVLSVVMAVAATSKHTSTSLEAMRASVSGLSTEIILAGSAASLPTALPTGVRAIPLPESSLVPHAWGAGIGASRGDGVALTTTQATVPTAWARTLVESLGDGAEAAGAGLRPAPGLGPVDRAVFHLRYGAFLACTVGEPRDVHELPGDNVAYPGTAVRRFLDARPGEGFWEIEYHREIRRAGGRIVTHPDATALFEGGTELSTMLHQRFTHGRHHGRWRVGPGGQSRWRVTLPAPLVPPVLLARAARRARAAGLPVLGAAPAFLTLAAAWACGEAVGALDRTTV